MKKDIKCPKCGTVFQVDESEYAAIAAQVRTAEFNEELDRRIANEHAKWEADLKILATKKDREILELNSRLGVKDSELRIKMMEEQSRHKDELQKKESEIERLKANAENEKLAFQNREKDLKAQHREQMLGKQEEIDQLRDLKMRLSTKMVGETLEQHCQILFEQAQSMGLFPNAYFSKDNTVVDGSKGDFIFRDYQDGDEYVSIMFEMKNEMDTTATKHRNDDFLEKLHKDRQRKNCEYAVLVSMLEKENELYNNGIVDKSHKFPKMIVIRPQFFMPVIRLISEASKKGYLERKHLMNELETARSQSLDFTKFEEKIDKFRDNFNKGIAAAHKKFEAATDGIDKTIEALEKQIKALREIKANFEASEQRLLKANEYADENLTVKKLTHGLPGIRKQIEEARDND